MESPRSLVLALALGLPATVYADTDDEIRTFASSKYTYCDAKLLAALWKQSVADAKAAIGYKVKNRTPAPIDRGLVEARKLATKNGVRCSYDEGGFSYGDAERLAKLWKKSVGDAKTLIADKVMRGDAQAVRALLKSAPAGDDVTTFLRQDRYTYCDAKLIAALWKQSVEEGKAYIGVKLRTNNAAAINRTLVQARDNAKKNPGARCRFGDAFTYADAQALAKLWGIAVTEVKARVEDKLLAGNEQYVRQQLKSGTAVPKQNKYTYCDAKIIAALWKKSVESAKSYIAAKLASKNTAAIDNTLAGARANARKNPAARCSFHDAGFSYDDAEKLAKLWKLDPSGAKVRVEDKILAGNEALVHELPEEAVMADGGRASIGWKIGVEVELLAPRGSSRRALAERYAQLTGGTVRTYFHPQSEPSLVPGVPVFENLTLGFEVRDAAGAPVASCVDDLTLQDDLVRDHPPLDGWFRIVSDDTRLLALVARVGRADAGPWEALAPVAALFGTEPEQFPEGMVRVTDRNRSPIAIASRLPGERERPCEIVTPPLERDHFARLDALLAPARELGFTLPAEAATHVHYDAAPLRSPRALRNLVRLVEMWGLALKELVGTNPRCRRLGAWPDALNAVVEEPGFEQLPWEVAREQLAEVGLTKYCDVNLKNLVHDVPDKPTIEVRVLPGLADTTSILDGAALFEAVLRLAVDAREIERGPPAADAGALLDLLPLADDVRRRWRR